MSQQQDPSELGKKRTRRSQESSSIWTDEDFKKQKMILIKAEVREKMLKIRFMRREENRKKLESEARLELLKAQLELAQIEIKKKKDEENIFVFEG